MRKLYLPVLGLCVCLCLFGCKKSSDSYIPPRPPAVDVTGTWNVDIYDEVGTFVETVTAVITMETNGTITGLADGVNEITGRLSSYNIRLKVDDGFGTKLRGVVNVAGDSIMGEWIDRWFDWGTWDATKL